VVEAGGSEVVVVVQQIIEDDQLVELVLVNAVEAEFIEFLRSAGGKGPKSAVYGAAALLPSSPRDGKPYVIVYGQPKTQPGPGVMAIVAYEHDGMEGKRLVANSLGMILEVDQTRFEQLTK
jgi:hypothetical protein